MCSTLSSANNKWQRRQQEIVRRLDRDGEAFLRLFVDRAGCTRVRFVEPDQVVTPAGRVGDPAASFGILTDSEDVETVLAFYVDGQPVDACQIQHRKANVDGNVKRGLPLFFPVRKNLRRAEKLLRNMSVVAEIQSAIALIRKHQGGTRSGVQQFAAGQADATLTQAATGRTTSFRRFGPGTILDAPGGIEYDFPAAGLDAANFVAVLQAELRAIASRLVMPEFMLTSDASNANYSSTMVAEGPAMRMFARLQADLVNDDLEVMWRVVRAAVEAGSLPAAALAEIEIQVSPPSLAVRDQKEEAEVHQIEYQNGILSPQTWCRRRGLDYDQEQANLVQHNQRPREVQGAELAAPPVGTPLDETHIDSNRRFAGELTEGEWDAAKHPRGGDPQNRGEFSAAGGPGAGTPSVDRHQESTASARAAAPAGPAYLAQKQRPSTKDDANDIAGRLGRLDDAPAKKPVLGEREWKSKDGEYTLKGTFLRLSKDGKAAILKPDQGEKNKRIELKRLSPDDHALVKGLLALPRNVSLSTEGLAEANKQAWLEAVVRDFTKLNELPAGSKLLKDIAANARNGISIKPRADDDQVGNRINFTSVPGGAQDVLIHYSPTDMIGWKVDGDRGDPTRPPFLALGKELWTGERAAKFRSMPPTNDEEHESGNFENELRDEFNARLKDGETKLRHRDVPKLLPRNAVER